MPAHSVATLLGTTLLGLLTAASLRADQQDPALEGLFDQLRRAEDAAAAAPIEAEIWQRWSSHDDPALQSTMLQGIRLMNAGDLQAALDLYTRLIEDAPDFAEAWNKRATLQFLLGNYAASELDIRKTLELEPFHFGALSGRGLVFAAQGNYEQAREALNAALEVHPTMEAVAANLRELEALLRQRRL
jgi:tetratricopeptide (TPR) repeat protein